MRKAPNMKVEEFRVDGPPNTLYGFFTVPRKGFRLNIQSSAGTGWDHVSVSLPNRCPTWEEMAFVKNLFWHESEVVMQLHVPAASHVNCHPYCLHLWRPQTAEEIAIERVEWGQEWPYGDLPSPGTIPLPPSILVGPGAGK